MPPGDSTQAGPTSAPPWKETGRMTMLAEITDAVIGTGVNIGVLSDSVSQFADYEVKRGTG